MFKRAYDAEFINKIVNNPKVLPFVSTDGNELDLSSVIEGNNDNICLIDKFGAILFIKHQIGIYEAHTQVLPEARGQWTLKFAKDCLEYMFCNTDAIEILTKVPEGNSGALGLARLLKFEFDFTNPNGWRNIDGIVPTDIYSLTIQKWMIDETRLQNLGKWFHSELESQYKLLNKKEALHDESDNHDKAVGICVRMIRGGQIIKAINFYNRWAVMASYIPMTIISLNPLIIDMQESLLLVTEDSFKVIYVR